MWILTGSTCESHRIITVPTETQVDCFSHFFSLFMVTSLFTLNAYLSITLGLVQEFFRSLEPTFWEISIFLFIVVSVFQSGETSDWSKDDDKCSRWYVIALLESPWCWDSTGRVLQSRGICPEHHQDDPDTGDDGGSWWLCWDWQADENDKLLNVQRLACGGEVCKRAACLN